MRIYREEKNMLVHVQPGQEFPEVRDWKDQTGAPIMFSLEFKNHRCDTDERLGNYMIDKGLAYKSLADLPNRLIPVGTAAMQAALGNAQ